MKGGSVTIFPLELVDQMKIGHTEVRDKDTQKLLSHAKSSDPKVQKLLENFIGNVFLVKDLDRAFELSS